MGRAGERAGEQARPWNQFKFLMSYSFDVDDDDDDDQRPITASGAPPGTCCCWWVFLFQFSIFNFLHHRHHRRFRLFVVKARERPVLYYVRRCCCCCNYYLNTWVSYYIRPHGVCGYDCWCSAHLPPPCYCCIGIVVVVVTNVTLQMRWGRDWLLNK